MAALGAAFEAASGAAFGATFGWISDLHEPPPRWDLRLCGWTLYRPALNAAGRHDPHCWRGGQVLIADGRGFTPAQRERLIETEPAGSALAARAQPCGQPGGRLVMLGIDDASERARLIDAGCAEVLPSLTMLCELDARARRAAEIASHLPRWRHLGPLTLDMFHRDGQVSGRWLGLHPREFGLIWRLTEHPGERVTRRQLLQDVWRHAHDPETNSVEVHVSRLRGKLARLGCAALVETVPSGGYRIAPGVKLHHGRPFGECGPDESGVGECEASDSRGAQLPGISRANSA